MSGPRRGFTLWEIVIVITLLGIVAGVTLPAFTSLGTTEGTRPVDGVLRLLRNARRLAIEQGMTVSVVLDPASRHYRVDTTGLRGMTGTLVDTILALQNGATLQSDSARVHFLFFPNSAAIADSLIVRSDGARMVVSVEPWNGVARADAR